MSRRDNAAQRCGRCRMHESLCVCSLMPRFTTRTRLCLIIHRFEDRKPTNTGRLAAECLTESEVIVRGHEGRPVDTFEAKPGTVPLLLFPHEGARDLRELDVVIVPALALDPAGQRIGYGAGYYDRALAMAAVVKVGVIFDFQLVSEVPAMDGDVAVDWVVTDRRVLRSVRAEELCAPSTGGDRDITGEGVVTNTETPCRS